MILPFLRPFSLVTVVQIQDFSVCIVAMNNLDINPLSLTYASIIPRIVFGITIFTLALTQTLKESVGMYKATKRWQLNQYVKLLVKDGILYFLVYVFLLSIYSFHPLPPTRITLPTISNSGIHRLKKSFHKSGICFTISA